MPAGNRLILLIALLMLWAVGLAYLLAWYVAFGEFDGYRTNVPGAALAYGGGGLIAVGLLYVGIGSLLRADRRRSFGAGPAICAYPELGCDCAKLNGDERPTPLDVC